MHEHLCSNSRLCLVFIIVVGPEDSGVDSILLEMFPLLHALGSSLTLSTPSWTLLFIKHYVMDLVI